MRSCSLGKILLVTEKSNPSPNQRDGGARLVASLRAAFGSKLQIMQFGEEEETPWTFCYPFPSPNRFQRRIANACFIAEQVQRVAGDFTDVIYLHISMQFGQPDLPLASPIRTWTFPMLLSPSYQISGEEVPPLYVDLERRALHSTHRIITPSHLEKDQLLENYEIPPDRIQVIPRGVDFDLLSPHTRETTSAPILCSIGSIKPQKNTLELIGILDEVRQQWPRTTLRLVGPTQDSHYGQKVDTEIQRRGLSDAVERCGYIPSSDLNNALLDTHLHLCASHCETFGRATFETLAMGLPNVVLSHHHAGHAYLQDLPHARFVTERERAVEAILEQLAGLPTYSTAALETGSSFCDRLLSRLVTAEIEGAPSLAISDYDGTLFHKECSVRTAQSLEHFCSYPTRVLCSARPLEDLLQRLSVHNLTVDYIIAYSGAVVADGDGRVLWTSPLPAKDITRLHSCYPDATPISFEREILQIATKGTPPPPGRWQCETYQGTTFISSRCANKCRAAIELLQSINWKGRVRAFGDGPYDRPLLTFFDGATTLTPIQEISRHEPALL